jgi:hypothetical protein
MTRNDSVVLRQETVRTLPGLRTSATRKGRVTVVWLVCWLFLPLALVASEFLVAGTEGKVKAGSVGWYFHSGQWRADIRTLTAAVRFLMNDDSHESGRMIVPTPETGTPDREPEFHSK